MLISPFQEMDVEQDVLIAILDSALTVPGSGKNLAAKAKVSQVHLSQIRQRRQVPRLRTAEKIARALNLPLEQRREWLERVQAVWAVRNSTRRTVEQMASDVPPATWVMEIKQMHGAATFAKQPSIAKAYYRNVRTMAELALGHVHPQRDPINYIELCFLMHEALSVLDRNDQGLWYGKRARLIAENIDDPRTFGATREELDYFRVNAIRAEAVALHNLKLSRQALFVCRQAEASDALKRNATFWKPHLYRDMINALEQKPRFAITEAEQLAEQTQRICETRADDFDPLLLFLISSSLARAFVSHHNYKDAYRVLTRWFDHLSNIQHLGTLHQVTFLRTFARWHSRQGDFGGEWKYLASRAALIATEAGLDHQLSGLRQDAGAHADAIMPNPKNFH